MTTILTQMRLILSQRLCNQNSSEQRNDSVDVCLMRHTYEAIKGGEYMQRKTEKQALIWLSNSQFIAHLLYLGLST